jgi:formate dehydrogenase alpha subunit
VTAGHATVDGVDVELRAGDTLLDLTRRAGAAVPTLCFVEGLPPEGGCRLCLVEVDGHARPLAACHTEASPGMRVRTGGSALDSLRRDVLALYLDHDGVGGFRGPARPGPFRDLLERYGLAAGAPSAAAPPAPRVDASHPYLRFDASLCITCRRCVHACAEVQGQFVYGIQGRGAATRLLFGPSERFADSPCVACGACVDACPTGAIGDVDRPPAAGVEPAGPAAAPAEPSTETVCGYCGVGCRIRVTAREGRVVRIDGVRDASVNRGQLCAKGRYAHAYHRSPARLTTPLLRSDGELRPVSWKEAIAFAARRLREVRGAHGARALAVLTSSRSTNEAAYLFQKLFRSVLGTNNVDCCARVCHSSSAHALSAQTGTSAATASYADIERARCVVLAGSNATEAHPVVGARIKQAVLGGVPLIVIDPRRIELAAYATLHLQLRPGTNVPLFNALAKVLLEAERVDDAYVAERVEGYAELRAFLGAFSLEEAAAVSGVPPGLIREAAELLGRRAPALFVHGLGLSELAQGTASVMALGNLAMLTGSIGREGAGMLTLRGQNNVQGNADMGAMPDQVTGYQRVDDPSVGERFAALWGAAPPAEPGLTIPEMLDAALRGRLRAMWVQGEDVVQSDPNETHVREALARLDLLVVQELFLSETARIADLVLPAAGALEQEGTFTNAERRIQLVRPSVPPPGLALPDWEVAQRLALALGADWSYTSAAQVMDEIALAAPRLFGGVSHARVSGDGLQWPCPRGDHPGTATVHADGFLRGRGRLVAVDYEASPEHGAPGYPLLLVTGRVLHHYNVGTMTRRTPQSELAPEDVLEIHPADATTAGIGDGARAVLESRWGSTVVRTRHSRRVPPGTLFLSFHFPETHANRVTGPARDPASHCPQYKATGVRVSPADEAHEGAPGAGPGC